MADWVGNSEALRSNSVDTLNFFSSLLHCNWKHSYNDHVSISNFITNHKRLHSLASLDRMNNVGGNVDKHSCSIMTYLKTSFGAVLRNNADVWRVHTSTNKRVQVIVPQVSHLKTKEEKWICV